MSAAGVHDATLMVIAKAPEPGRCKTRLCPPLDHDQAASVARAALWDTLQTVSATPVRRRVIVLDGELQDWMPEGFEIWPQVSGGLDVRLAAAFDRADGPSLLIGMDTPQLCPEALEAALAMLDVAGGGVLGPCPDGGFWAAGLTEPTGEPFRGVPMSTSGTGEHQLRRMKELGVSVALLDEVQDVDSATDLLAVARLAPSGRFAAEVSGLVDCGALR